MNVRCKDILHDFEYLSFVAAQFHKRCLWFQIEADYWNKKLDKAYKNVCFLSHSKFSEGMLMQELEEHIWLD